MLHLAASPVSKEALSLCSERLNARPVARQVGAETEGFCMDKQIESATKPVRKAISKTLRFEVFKRDGFICQYCGAKPPGAVLQADHINPVAKGGRNGIDNLVTSCQPCNLGKGVRLLTVAPQSLAEKAAQVAEREAQLLGYQEIMEAKRQRLDSETWRVVEVLFGPVESTNRYDFASTQRFIERLGLDAVLDAAEKAQNIKRGSTYMFRYFCGICWRSIREVPHLAPCGGCRQLR